MKGRRISLKDAGGEETLRVDRVPGEPGLVWIGEPNGVVPGSVASREQGGGYDWIAVPVACVRDLVRALEALAAEERRG